MRVAEFPSSPPPQNKKIKTTHAHTHPLLLSLCYHIDVLKESAQERNQEKQKEIFALKHELSDEIQRTHEKQEEVMPVKC